MREGNIISLFALGGGEGVYPHPADGLSQFTSFEMKMRKLFQTTVIL